MLWKWIFLDMEFFNFIFLKAKINQHYFNKQLTNIFEDQKMVYACQGGCGRALTYVGRCPSCQAFAVEHGLARKAWGWKKMLALIIGVMGTLFLGIIIVAPR